MKNESIVTTKCPEIMFTAYQVQKELKSRWWQWSKTEWMVRASPNGSENNSEELGRCYISNLDSKSTIWSFSFIFKI